MIQVGLMNFSLMRVLGLVASPEPISAFEMCLSIGTSMIDVASPIFEVSREMVRCIELSQAEELICSALASST